MTIFPCSVENAKKFTTFESTVKIMDLQGRELKDPKEAEAIAARKTEAARHWQEVKSAKQERSDMKNSLTITMYALLPASAQDKNQLIKDGLKKHVQDQLQAFFSHCDISSTWAQTPNGSSRLCVQFFIVDRRGLKPTEFLNFGDFPVSFPNGTTLRPLHEIKYIDVGGPHPASTNFPAKLLEAWDVKQCCYKAKRLGESTNICWKSLRSDCGIQDHWYDTWRNNNQEARMATQTEHAVRRRNAQQEAQDAKRRKQEEAELFCAQRQAEDMVHRTPVHESSTDAPVVVCRAWTLGRCTRTHAHPTDPTPVCCSERVEGTLGYSVQFKTCPYENTLTECPYDHPLTAAADLANTAAECVAYANSDPATAELEPMAADGGL